MEHFYQKLQERTFFNYKSVYDEMIEAFDTAKFVEIGVWRGQSVCYAAVEIINKNKNITIDAIDTWEGSPEETLHIKDPHLQGTIYDIFLANIEPVKHIITPVRMDSVKAAARYEDKSIDFVFIDGSHLYEAVKADIEAWLPKVKVGGYIGGHDYGNHNEPLNGVQKAVDERFNTDIKTYNTGWGSWLHQIKA
jgi:cephalosporin hydroxylase